MNTFEKVAIGAAGGFVAAYAAVQKLPIPPTKKMQRKVGGIVVGGIIGYLWPDPTTCPPCPTLPAGSGATVPISVAAPTPR